MKVFIETINAWGGNFLQFAWPILWQSSLLIGVLFVFDFVFRRKIRAAVRHALWLVVLIKLLLPPTLALPTSLAWWVRQSPPPEKPPERKLIVTYGDTIPAMLPPVPIAAVPAFTPPPPPPLPKVSTAGWATVASAAVALGLLAWMLSRWRAVGRSVRNSTEPDETLLALLADAKRTLNVRRRVNLRLTHQAMSPAVCGLFRATILLPRQLADLPANQLRAVLLHELLHLKRGDVWVNCAQALLQIFYWWHPLLWFANARIRRVREEAVDDAVMLTLHDDAEAYAPTLLEVAKLALNRPLASLGLVGILESRSALRQRIERLVNFSAPRKAGLSVLSVLGVAAFAALAMPMGERPVPSESSESRLIGNSTQSAPARDRAASTTNSGIEVSSLNTNSTVSYNDSTGITTASNGVKITYLGTTLIADAAHINQAAGILDAYGNVRWEEGGKVTTAQSLHVDMNKMRATAELVQILQPPPEKRPLLPVPNTYATNLNLTLTRKVRQAMMAKLDKIRLKEVFYPKSTLGEVLKDLMAKSRDADPQNRGVNILLNPDYPKVFDPTTNDYLPEPSHPPIEDVQINIEQPIAGLRLADALDAIVKCAKSPIHYSVEDYAIFFSWRGPETEPLYIRTFAVDPNTFYAALEQVTGTELPGPAPARATAGNTKSITVTNLSPVFQAVLTYFATLDVHLDSPAAKAAGKSVFWNDRAGQLLIRATSTELDAIEAGLQKLNVAPPSQGTSLPIPNFYATNTMQKLAATSPQSDSLVVTVRDTGYWVNKRNVEWSELKQTLADSRRANPEFRLIIEAAEPAAVQFLRPLGDLAAELKVLVSWRWPQGTVIIPPARPKAAAPASTREMESRILIRTFAVVTNASFFTDLENATGTKLPAPTTAGSIGSAKTRADDMARVNATMSAYFSTLGVDLVSPAAQTAGKNVFWNHRGGQLSVQATASELNVIEAGLQKLNALAPRDTILVHSYRVDPNTVYQGLERAMGTNTTEANAGAVFEQYFASLKLDFRPPKSIFWNARSGSLLARATAADLDAIAAALQKLNPPSPETVTASPATPKADVVWQRPATNSNTLQKPQTPAKTEAPPGPSLFIRTFRVDPNTFFQGLERVAGTNVSDGNVSVALQKFFATLSVDLSPPKSVFWNDRSGELLVRATAPDLDLIEAAMQLLNRVPMQVNIRARFVEVTVEPGTDGSALYLGSWPTNANPGNSIPSNAGTFPGSIPGNSPTATFPQSPGSHQLDATNDSTKFTGILTDPQFRVVLRAMDQRKNVNVIASPEVTTVSGRQAQVQVADVLSIVTANSNALAPNVQTMPFGPTLDVIPYVSADGYTIQMTVKIRLNEFLGYDDPGPFVVAGHQTNSNVIPLPRIRLREMTTSANVWDGQTLVLGGLMAEDVKRFKDKVPVLGSIPIVGRPFRRESTQTIKKNLMIFVTPTVLDQAGNRLHADEDLPFARDSIPPQSPTNRIAPPQK